jgi:hypothetical protein
MIQKNQVFGVRGRFRGVLVLCAVLACPQVYAETRPAISENKYITTFDVATFFRGDCEATYVQAYCHISTMNLQFIRVDTAFMAMYRTTMTVTDELQRKVFEHALVDTVMVKTFWETDRLRPARVLCFSMELEPGTYVFDMRVRDLETRQDFQLRKGVNIENYNKSETTISTLFLAERVKPAEGRSHLVKADYEVHPNVCRVVGPDMDSLFVYAEIYRPKSQENPRSVMNIRYYVADENGRIVWERESEVPGPAASMSVIACLDVANLNPGYYNIIMQVDFPKSGQTLLSSSSFLVLKPDLEAGQYARLLRMRFGEGESF